MKVEETGKYRCLMKDGTIKEKWLFADEVNYSPQIKKVLGLVEGTQKSKWGNDFHREGIKNLKSGIYGIAAKDMTAYNRSRAREDHELVRRLKRIRASHTTMNRLLKYYFGYSEKTSGNIMAEVAEIERRYIDATKFLSMTDIGQHIKREIRNGKIKNVSWKL